MWLYDNTEFRIEAFIIVRSPMAHLSRRRGLSTRSAANTQGFDEFMNVVLDEADEVYEAKPGKEAKPRRSLGGFA